MLNTTSPAPRDPVSAPIELALEERRRRPGPGRPRAGGWASGRSSPGLAVDDDRLAAEHRVADPAGELPARVRACCGPGSRGGSGSTSQRCGRVDHAEVRWAAGGDRTGRAGRRGRRSPPGATTGAPARRTSVSTPGSTSSVSVSASAVSRPSIPGGASSNGRSFASVGCGAWSVAMASMVPSARPRLDRLDVGVGPQRRVHLEDRVEGRARGVGEREVVRRGLRGDGQPARLGGAHELDRPGRRQVEEVHPGAR